MTAEAASNPTTPVKKEVMKKIFIAKEPYWAGIADLHKSANLLVKIRYGHKKSPARVEKLSDDELKITFKKPQEAITPGQAAVFYKKDVVLGGAWISEVLE